MTGSPSVLVTGGAGFTGSAVVAHLRTLGWSVQLLERVDARASSDAVADSITRSFAAAEPDVVLSIATRRTCASAREVAAMLDANVRLPGLLLAELARRGGGRIVTTSSFQTSRGATAPTLYAATRQSVDALAGWACAHASVRWVSLAPTTIHGPGDQRTKLVAALLAAARTGAPIDMVAPTRLVDFVHVSDVAHAYEVAARALLDGSLGAGERFDVCSGEQLTLARLVDVVERETGRPIDARWGAVAMRPSDLVDPPASPVWLPGWAPTRSITQTLRDGST